MATTRPMLITTDLSLVDFPTAFRDMWCVYEHRAVDPTGQTALELVYVNACRLRDVFNLTDAYNNSEWFRIFNPGKVGLQIRIIRTTNDSIEARNFAMDHVRSFPTMPRCNLMGYMMHTSTRPIVCSNGQTYSSQSEAARLLNISQSAISAHLGRNGGPVKGYTFQYKDAITP